jgi:hypothetical protein
MQSNNYRILVISLAVSVMRFRNYMFCMTLSLLQAALFTIKIHKSCFSAWGLIYFCDCINSNYNIADLYWTASLVRNKILLWKEFVENILFCNVRHRGSPVQFRTFEVV